MDNQIKQVDFENIYISLFENMLDGLAYCQMVFDNQEQPVDFIYVKVSKNFEDLTGLKNAEGKKVSELIPGIRISNPELLKTYGRVALGGKPERFETYVKPLARWFLVSVYSPQKNFFMAIFQDITYQKQIAKELANAVIAARNVMEDLQAEKNKLDEIKANDEAILESIGDGLVAVDQNARVIFMNDATEKLLGWKKNDVIGKSWFETVPMEDKKGNSIPNDKRPTQQAISHRKTTTTTTTTYYFTRKDKTKFPVAITATPIILKGDVVGAICVYRDITKEKEIENAKTEFVSITSHELRTPLTAIDGLVSMILDGEYGVVNQGLRQPLKDINASSERLINLLNDLLNLSRIQAGKLEYTVSEFSILDVITEAVHLLQPLSRQKGLSLTIAKFEPVIVKGDPNKVREILNNLIGNSFKFTDKGGITISTKVLTNKVEIHVSDTGIGIAKENQDKLFGQFQQLESSQVKESGTGLGLHISREMVRKMGGDLWIEKSEIGTGSTFAFSIQKAKRSSDTLK